ncbi:MAG: divalent metal cation transporter [Chloroherpetonaceae bacterium]|nr:divalent metal cation transporter [Chloroherpetonaceae bacterium]
MLTSSLRTLLGAAFLMATSAIGPGFLTQTTVFTERLGASFGFVILASVLIDIAAQLNIWRILAVAEQRAQDIANRVHFGLGFLLSFLVAIGGLAFSIGNAAGAGLGLNVLTGLAPEWGAVLSALAAIAMFLYRDAGKAMDIFMQTMGLLLLGLTLYVALTAKPPLQEAAVRTFVPETIDMFAILTLVGGTVGGYITFAGGHRLLEAGIKGQAALSAVSQSAVSGIVVTAVMRSLLFMATLGVLAQGTVLDASNPTAAVFRAAAGEWGYRFFGVVLWAAAITSLIGAAYTSVSFLQTLSPWLERQQPKLIVLFIALATFIFATVGRPVKVLVIVGALNGLILPLALSVMLLAAYRTDIVGDYKHPRWLTAAGIAVSTVMAVMGVYAFFKELERL